MMAGSSRKKVAGDKGSSHGRRIKGWYDRNSMIYEPLSPKHLNMMNYPPPSPQKKHTKKLPTDAGQTIT